MPVEKMKKPVGRPKKREYVRKTKTEIIKEKVHCYLSILGMYPPSAVVIISA